MSNEQDMLIWKLQNDLAKARLALAQIYEIVDEVYCWDMKQAMDGLERSDVDEIVKILCEYFEYNAGKSTNKECVI